MKVSQFLHIGLSLERNVVKPDGTEYKIYLINYKCLCALFSLEEFLVRVECDSSQMCFLG